MASSRKSPEWLRFYNGSFLRGAHQLLAWGYEDTRRQHKIHALALEEGITGDIVEAIKLRLDDPRTPSKYTTHYFVDDESHVRGSGKAGKTRQRLDIVVVCSSKLPRPEFIFEAKLLRRNGFPIGLYTGYGGMQCFIRGDYAANYPVAAMIGYMQTDDSKRWLAELKRSFTNDVHNVLRIKASLRKVTVIPHLNNEWISVHKRGRNSDIGIFHIFLDCT